MPYAANSLKFSDMAKDVLKSAKDKYKKAQESWNRIYAAAKEDLRFQSDEEGAQWDARDYEARRKKGRALLTIDQLSQFINQVSNDIRMNTPTINVIPHAGGADLETAEIFQGLIRDIEQTSNADAAYDYAVGSAIKGSFGFIAVDHRYKDASFDQELFIRRIVNPFGVLLDPDSIEPDGSDATCAFVLDDISVHEFKEHYPKAQPISFGDDETVKEDYVTICEYFKIDEEEITIGLLPDGTSEEVKEGVEYLKTRPSTKNIVRRYKLAGEDVLEETTFPGKYIPIIPVYGEEAWIGGERYLMSLIRKAKDSQRRYNYLASVEADLLKKSNKAVIQAVGGTTENYASDYLNPDDAIVLRYDQTDAKGNPAPPPNILPPYPIPSGIVNAMARASDDIKATMGLYNSFLGQRSNETSGVAIQSRKMEGDRAIFHFGDNLVRSITQVGRVLVSAIPEIYDTPRFVRIIGKEDDSDVVGINGAITEGQERTFDLTTGQYSVRVTTGASYATMREEAADFFQQVIQSQPALMNVAGDLMFKYMDFPGAQALAERVKKTIPPQLLDETLDPQAQAIAQENEQLKQAIEALQMEMTSLAQQLENKQAEIQVKVQDTTVKAQSDIAKNQIEVAKLRLDEQKINMEYQIKQAEVQLKERELALKEQGAVLASLNGTMSQSSGVQVVE